MGLLLRWSDDVRARGRGYYRCARGRLKGASKRRRKGHKMLVDEAGGKCLLCGYARCQEALHFHHVDPESKAFHLGHQGILVSLACLEGEAKNAFSFAETAMPRSRWVNFPNWRVSWRVDNNRGSHFGLARCVNPGWLDGLEHSPVNRQGLWVRIPPPELPTRASLARPVRRRARAPSFSRPQARELAGLARRKPPSSSMRRAAQRSGSGLHGARAGRGRRRPRRPHRGLAHVADDRADQDRGAGAEGAGDGAVAAVGDDQEAVGISWL